PHRPEGRGAQGQELCPGRPDPPAAGTAGRHPGRPAGGHRLAGGVLVVPLLPLAAWGGGASRPRPGLSAGDSMPDVNGHTVGSRILGVDPGLQTTGYAVLEVGVRGPLVCEAGIIRSTEGRKTADMAQRVASLYNGIVEVMDQFHPRLVAVEQLYAHYDHPRTAILMAHAR